MVLQQPHDVQIHPVTLRFSGGFEDGFLTDYQERSVSHIRIALLLGAFIHAIYGILDGRLDATACYSAWLIRFCVVTAILLVFPLTFIKGFQRYLQCVAMVLVALCGAGVISMIGLSAEYQKLYFSGVLVVVVYGFAFCRLRFIHSTLASLSILAVYEYFVISRNIHTGTEFWNNNFHIIAITAIGMFSSYHQELYARREYLQNLMIAEERRKTEELALAQEKGRIVENLHDGIGGIITNIHFLSEMDHREAERKDRALNAISELSGECLNEIRTFINVLAETEKSWQTLCAEMRHFGNVMLESHQISFDFSADGNVETKIPDSLTAINLMRVYREALANVVKHSGADQVSVRVMITDNGFEMTMHDNGVWKVRESGYSGQGVANIRRRAVDMGGSCTFDTSAGTRIQMTIPLEVA